MSAAADEIVEACAVAAEAQDRAGYEWVRDSLWAAVLRRAGENVRKLKGTFPGPGWSRAQEIAELEAKVFVPGLWRCAKCSLRLVATNLHVNSGGMSANNEPHACPNGCGPMWRVSEREAGNEAIDREDRLRAALEQIATGEGCYGAQALEYKNIARVALGREQVG